MNLLALIWVGLIGLGVILYIILDGFDLGIGILSPFFRNRHDRNIMISSILPVWDGNETWLVFGGATLYGAFPLAFSIILPALYVPALIMIIALLFRGVAFEFRLKSKNKQFWDYCFFVGSLVATIVQGLALGTFVQGFIPTYNTAELAFSNWLNPFGGFCALALIAGYALLGSNWLINKTSGQLQERSFVISGILQYVILFAVIVVSIWSPFLDPAIQERWFNLRNMPFLAILPLLTLFFLFLHWSAIKQRREYVPFWSSIGIFIMCYAGFIISSYPYIVPRKITYIQAAASRSSLLFMLVGACIMLPALLYYTYYSYKIFRGKVSEPLGY